MAMPQDPKPTTDPPADPDPPETPGNTQEEEIGDFINRHVLEKDSVFFEG
jgi:hypothetical protein